MTQANKFLVTLTKVTLGIILLTLWVSPVLSSSHVIEAENAPSQWKEIGLELCTKSFAIWLIEEVVGLLYPWILLKAQRKGHARNEIKIGSSSYENLAAPIPLWWKFVQLLLRELGSLVIIVLSVLMAVGLYIMQDYLSCRYLTGIAVQIAVLEFYRLVFPGVVLSWLVYMVRNTWGINPAPAASPFGLSDDDDRSFSGVVDVYDFDNDHPLEDTPMS